MKPYSSSSSGEDDDDEGRKVAKNGYTNSGMVSETNGGGVDATEDHLLNGLGEWCDGTRARKETAHG
jgi:hypothetical protein